MRCGGGDTVLQSSKHRSEGCHRSATFPLKEKGKPGEPEPAASGANPAEKHPVPRREGAACRRTSAEEPGGKRESGQRGGLLPAPRSRPLCRTGENECLFKKKKKNSKGVLENRSVGNFNPLCKRKGGQRGSVATAGLGTEGDRGFHAKRGAQGAEGLKAAGWGGDDDDGSVSNLPRAEASDLINIYTVPFYHSNANGAHRRCRRC